jgi:hypothetical protein
MRISVIWAPIFTLCFASLASAQGTAVSAAPVSAAPVGPPSAQPAAPAAVAPAAPQSPPVQPGGVGSEAVPSAQPAAAPAGTAEAPVNAPLTSAPPAAAAPKLAPFVDWYQPGPRDPRLPSAAEAEHKRHHATARAALYGMVDSHAFVLGRVSGVGTEIRVGMSGRYLGFTLGTYLPTADVSIGADFFRHSGWRVAGSQAHALWLLAPTIEPRVFFSPRFDANSGQRTVVALGTSLFGVRLTHGHCLVDLRLPRIDGWVMPFTTRTSGAMSLGGSLVVGYDF